MASLSVTRKTACRLIALRLQAANVAVVIGGREQLDRAVFAALQRVHVQFVHLLAQHHALAGAQGFAPFVGAEVLRMTSPAPAARFPENLPRTLMTSGCRSSKPVGKIFVLELGEDAFAVEHTRRYETR